MPRLTRSELEGASLVWLLRVSYAGREFLFSSVSISPGAEPVDDDGEVKGIDGRIGSDLSIGEEWALMSTISSARSVSFDGVVFPVDVGALIEAGHSLSLAFGELSLWREGDSYDARRVFIYGRLGSPEYGADGEPVAFSVEENPFDDSAIIPKSTQRISADDTWGDAYDGDEGEYYPIVFGEPGTYRRTTGSVIEIPATKALGAAYDSSYLLNPMRKLLIAGHAVQASTVTVYDATADKYEEYTPAFEFDSLGQPVTVLDITTTATITGTNTDFWIQWDGGGALANRERTAPLSGGGDLLEWFLLQSSLRVDQGRLSAAKQLLNAFKFAGFIDTPVSPWEWLEDNLLPLLPVSIVSGDDGVYPVVWRMDATADQAVEQITTGTGGAVRTDPVIYENSYLSVINEIRIDWAWSPQDSTHKMFTTMKGTPDPDSAHEFANYYAKASEARYGSRVETIESAILYDEATVFRILNWRLRASGFLHRTALYTVSKAYGWLSLGDVVTVTDSDLSITDRVGLIQSVMWESEEAITLGILLIDDPARDMV